jgi:mannose-6-phosphate isomerase-like protein (cupin superfamily)
MVDYSRGGLVAAIIIILRELMRGEKDERPWGRYEVLEDCAGFKVKRIEVEPGHRLSLQTHARRSEHWVVVQGVADVVCGDRELRLERGQHVNIAVGAQHRVGNSGTETLIFVEVQFGDYLGEDDIVRLQDDYQR